MIDDNTPDATRTEIGAAVEPAHTGDPAAARCRLKQLWERIGPARDPLHRCTLAHYAADLYDDPAQALVWDVRALHGSARNRAGMRRCWSPHEQGNRRGLVRRSAA